MTPAHDPSEQTRAAAKQYSNAWHSKNLDAIESLLAADVKFEGPLSKFSNRKGVIASYATLMPALAEFRVRNMVVDGGTAVLIYDFVCHEPVGSLRMAERLECVAGKIHSIELFFDPTPLK